MYGEASLETALFLEFRCACPTVEPHWSQVSGFMGLGCNLVLGTTVIQNGHLTISGGLVRGLDFHFDFHRVDSGGWPIDARRRKFRLLLLLARLQDGSLIIRILVNRNYEMKNLQTAKTDIIH
jgi:hypothetical protein